MENDVVQQENDARESEIVMEVHELYESDDVEIPAWNVLSEPLQQGLHRLPFSVLTVMQVFDDVNTPRSLTRRVVVLHLSRAPQPNRASSCFRRHQTWKDQCRQLVEHCYQDVVFFSSVQQQEYYGLF